MRGIRRILLILVLTAVCILGGGCARIKTIAVQSGLKANPYYQLGDTWWEHGGVEEYHFNQLPSELNEIYRELYERLRNWEDSAQLYALVRTEDFWKAYYAVLYDHPEFFWIGSNIEVEESSLTGKTVSYRISTTVPPQERESVRAALETAADACIAGISPDASDYEKIKYVYEYLIETTDYGSERPDNQNVQSALIGHVSVCAGYARAFQYILHRMGMFCTYVTGSTIVSGELASAASADSLAGAAAAGTPAGTAEDGTQDGAASAGTPLRADHAWNIVRIGDTYYHVDVTWGDPVFVGDAEGSKAGGFMNYNYLCCSDEQISATHTPDADLVMPGCPDGSLDYYRLNGLYYEAFDYDQVYQALMNSVWEGQSAAVMKFGSDEAYETAVYEIFTDNMIDDAAQYLMQTYGGSTWSYSYHTDDLFRLITIYW